MSMNERPGIYTEYSVKRGVRGFGRGGAVGLAATALAGETGKVVAVSDEASARAEFGGNMAQLVKILLENGAGVIYCCRAESGGYDSAFSALMAVENIKYMLCDSREASVHAKMLSAIDGADEKSKYRIGIVESGNGTRAALISDAEALGSERMVLVSHHETEGVAGSVAAAVCGVLAGESDPAVPLNGAVLAGLGDIGGNFSDADLNLLVRGGVLPLETRSGSICVIRGITTRSKTEGVADDTWREVNTILIVDEVIPALRDALKIDFARAKNTAQTRGAIRTRVVIELENYLKNEIIESYDNVTVMASADAPDTCVVSFDFTVAHGLNIIRLSANITV